MWRTLYRPQIHGVAGAKWRVAPIDSPQKDGDSPHTSHETDLTLFAIAEPARTKKRLSPEQTRGIVLQLCQDRYLTGQQIATLLSRYAERLQDRLISPMLRTELLETRFPSEPNRPDQAYTSKKATGES